MVNYTKKNEIVVAISIFSDVSSGFPVIILCIILIHSYVKTCA